jgi:hypothetical protein
MALATPIPQEKCDQARVKAWKTYASCVDTVVARQYGGANFDVFGPFAKCRHTYFSQWGRFQPKASLAGSTCIGSRYTDNGDQTVTDNLSGLVWEKKDTLGGIHDKLNTYSWSTGTKEDGTTFTNFLLTVNGGGGFAGSNGWRLPTLAELQTIILDFGCTGVGEGPTCLCPSDPCVDAALAPGSSTYSFIYWSATSYVTIPYNSFFAWEVFFGNGDVGTDPKTNNSYVRAVRGGL